MTTSLPQTLSDSNLEAIVKRFNMTEITSGDNQPYITLESQLPMVKGNVGHVRVFEGGPLDKLVTCTIVVPQMMLDSHMIYGFMPKDSAVPHFTLDSVSAGEHFAFHLDITPRVDLGCNIDYMNEVFQPLTEKFNAAEAVEGLEPAQISPRQRAIMSPWMLVHRATEQAFKELFTHTDDYLQYWFNLIEQGVTTTTDSKTLIERDKANRAAIFDPEIDPVWGRVDGLIGADVGERIRALLRGE